MKRTAEHYPNEVTVSGITMAKHGLGLYPYDCQMKDKYPMDMIYRSEEFGAWISFKAFLAHCAATGQNPCLLATR